MMNALFYSLVGALAGFISGTMGVGGGVVVVPALFFLFNHEGLIPAELSMHFAVGTSLAIMVFTSQASIRAHSDLSDILWPLYRKLVLGIVLGAFWGVFLVEFIPVGLLQLLLIAFLTVVIFRTLWSKNTNETLRFPPSWLSTLVSAFIGFISGLLGLGGGMLVIPYLAYMGVDLRKMAAVSALCTLTVALVGTLTLILMGLGKTVFPPYSTGYIYWPAVLWVAIPSCLMAPVGAKLTYRLPIKQLKYGFVAVLIISIINLMSDL